MINGNYPKDQCYPACWYVVPHLTDGQVWTALRAHSRNDIIEQLGKEPAMLDTFGPDSDLKRAHLCWMNKLCIRLSDELGIYNHDGKMNLVHYMKGKQS